MRLTPVNNYLTVRAVEIEKEGSSILLPQDYRAAENPFAVVEVVKCSGENGTLLWPAGLRIVVEAHMLRDIEHNGETFTVVKEQYIIGTLSDG